MAFVLPSRAPSTSESPCEPAADQIDPDAVVILAALWVARRSGDAFGGWLARLPLTSAPVAAFLAIEHGPAFAAAASAGSVAAVASQASFCMACTAASRRGWQRGALLGAVGFAGRATIVQAANFPRLRCSAYRPSCCRLPASRCRAQAWPSPKLGAAMGNSCARHPRHRDRRRGDLARDDARRAGERRRGELSLDRRRARGVRASRPGRGGRSGGLARHGDRTLRLPRVLRGARFRADAIDLPLASATLRFVHGETRAMASAKVPQGSFRNK